MKLSVIRALYLSLSLLIAQAPFALEARTPDRRDDDKRERDGKGSPQNRLPSGNARVQGGVPRNPLTGSSVGGGNRPNANNRPNDRDRKPDNRPGGGGGGNNNRPGGGGASNNNKNKGPDNKPNNPVNRPTPLPATRPMPLPANPGVTRPAPKPGNNNNKNKGPDNKPGGGGNNNNRPGGNNNNNKNRPDPKPPTIAKNRPGNARAQNRFVPGKVVYPNQITRPATRPNHPAHHANRPNQGRPKNVNQVVSNTNINQNWGNQWNNNTTIWNQKKVVNNRPVVINNNFRNSVNYAYRPSSWGSRPWWSSSTYHSWHHGSWNYGWNNRWNHYHSYHRPYRPPLNYFPGYRPGPSYHYHDHDDFNAGKVVAWGLAAWGLGSLFYDSGYGSYRNPYQAPPVQTSRQTVINYTQPISVVASKEVPVPEEAALSDAEKSSAAIERARAEFGNADYLAALKSTDEAISFAPTDSALHEFRALCLFALGRYGDAAGVLNPVLASGPGWDWATMAEFYPSSDSYTAQLRKLEAYVEGNPDSADSHFVLGYHYMVAGFIDEAYAMFDRVVTLQPADMVAVQLRNLAESSSANAEGEADDKGSEEAAAADASVNVEPIDPTDLEGAWKAPSADGKSITLTLGADGNFTWNYEGATDGKVLSGEWSIDEDGQLVLAADDVQMVADVSLDGNAMRFVLAGSPVGDPGLSFQRL